MTSNHDDQYTGWPAVERDRHKHYSQNTTWLMEHFSAQSVGANTITCICKLSHFADMFDSSCSVSFFTVNVDGFKSQIVISRGSSNIRYACPLEWHSRRGRLHSIHTFAIMQKTHHLYGISWHRLYKEYTQQRKLAPILSLDSVASH